MTGGMRAYSVKRFGRHCSDVAAALRRLNATAAKLVTALDESSWLVTHDRLPGSTRTRRLRKKRATMLRRHRERVTKAGCRRLGGWST